LATSWIMAQVIRRSPKYLGTAYSINAPINF
jgi:hypothetical protein